jgi:hypothetical protein
MKPFWGVLFLLLLYMYGYCQDTTHVNPSYAKGIDKITSQIDENCGSLKYKTIVVKYSYYNNEYTTEEYIIDTSASLLSKLIFTEISYDTLARGGYLRIGEPHYIARIDTQLLVFYYDQNSLIKVVDKMSKSVYYIDGDNVFLGSGESADFFVTRLIRPYGNKFRRYFKECLTQ